MLGDLPDGWELDAREPVVLEATARQADLNRALEGALEADGVMVEGSQGQRRLNAAATELRQVGSRWSGCSDRSRCRSARGTRRSRRRSGVRTQPRRPDGVVVVARRRRDAPAPSVGDVDEVEVRARAARYAWVVSGAWAASEQREQQWWVRWHDDRRACERLRWSRERQLAHYMAAIERLGLQSVFEVQLERCRRIGYVAGVPDSRTKRPVTANNERTDG